MRTVSRISVAVCLSFAVLATASAQPFPRVVATGFKRPTKLFALPSGSVLVGEGGDAINRGRVSVLDPAGNRRTLIDGLPSGLAAPNNDMSGAAGVALRNRTVYIAISAGDQVLAGPVPGSERPNPSKSSPIFSSVLALDLDRDVEATSGDFLVTPADHATLAAGTPVTVTNPARESATLRLVANFPDSVPEPRPDYADNVRSSNPFGIEIGDGCTLWVADASRNLIWQVDTCNGGYRAAVQFPPYRNPGTVGPPVLDAVPTSVHVYDGDLLVSFLTGQPFVPGLAEVKRVKPATGEAAVLFRDLRMVTDMLPHDARPDGFFVLEFSQDPAAGAPGRVLFFDSPAATPLVLTDRVITPTCLGIDAKTGDLLVAEIGPGRVVAVAMPR